MSAFQRSPRRIESWGEWRLLGRTGRARKWADHRQVYGGSTLEPVGGDRVLDRQVMSQNRPTQLRQHPTKESPKRTSAPFVAQITAQHTSILVALDGAYEGLKRALTSAERSWIGMHERGGRISRREGFCSRSVWTSRGWWSGAYRGWRRPSKPELPACEGDRPRSDGTLSLNRPQLRGR